MNILKRPALHLAILLITGLGLGLLVGIQLVKWHQLQSEYKQVVISTTLLPQRLAHFLQANQGKETKPYVFLQPQAALQWLTKSAKQYSLALQPILNKESGHIQLEGSSSDFNQLIDLLKHMGQQTNLSVWQADFQPAAASSKVDYWIELRLPQA